MSKIIVLAPEFDSEKNSNPNFSDLHTQCAVKFACFQGFSIVYVLP